MCGSSPKMPKAPPIQPPEPRKEIELNPRRKKVEGRRTKKAGTRRLQIPLGGTGSKSGLNTGS